MMMTLSTWARWVEQLSVVFCETEYGVEGWVGPAFFCLPFRKIRGRVTSLAPGFFLGGTIVVPVFVLQEKRTSNVTTKR